MMPKIPQQAHDKLSDTVRSPFFDCDEESLQWLGEKIEKLERQQLDAVKIKAYLNVTQVSADKCKYVACNPMGAMPRRSWDYHSEKCPYRMARKELMELIDD